MRCDVHYYTDWDTADKDVFYCPDCNAWICRECKRRPFKRAWAAFNRLFYPHHDVVIDIVKVAIISIVSLSLYLLS